MDSIHQLAFVFLVFLMQGPRGEPGLDGVPGKSGPKVKRKENALKFSLESSFKNSSILDSQGLWF